MKNSKEYYAVAIACSFEDNLEHKLFGKKIKIEFDDGAPKMYLPVYDRYEDALKCAKGNEELVWKIKKKKFKN